MTREEKNQICKNRDSSYDGKFYLAVKSTGIVCKPSCPSKVPLEKNMEFFDTLEEAEAAGYRPCKVCMKAKKDAKRDSMQKSLDLFTEDFMTERGDFVEMDRRGEL